MSYVCSNKHLQNLAYARERAIQIKAPCSYCGKMFVKAGLKAHERSCSENRANLVECPACKKFFVKKDKRVKTCSHACANSFFRSGSTHGNWAGGKSYRTICFQHYPKECLVCGESKVIDVHHIDHNRENNEPANLIPLCPTHHRYCHRKKLKELIWPEITKKLKKF